MSLALLVMTDGRAECLDDTLRSAAENLHGDISLRILHNDSPDPLFRDWLARNYSDAWTVVHTSSRSGFGGAIRNAWSHLRDSPEPFDYVIHLEDDFTFNRPVALEYVTALLDEQHSILQVALRRQPWNDDERRAGGVVEQHPHAYQDRVSNLGCPYLTQRLFFTTNPCVYRRSLLDQEWPTGPNSEGFFTHRLLNDPAISFAFWGARTDEPWVEHIGKERVGVGY